MLLALTACLAPPAGPPSIVLVSLDTTRADRLGAYGNPDGLTPNLDRFAAESVVFTHAYSQATTTAPSHASLFTSRYPSEEYSKERAPALGTDKPLLAGILRAYGYETGAFVAGADLQATSGLDAGFSTYRSAADFASLYHTVPMALAWLDGVEGNAPTFTFVHGYDAHSRYLKPPPYGFAFADRARGGLGREAIYGTTEALLDGALHPDLSAFELVTRTMLRPRAPESRARLASLEPQSRPVEDADLDLVRGVYDGAVAYGDAMFGRLMAGLDARDLLDHTVVVVFSDHGEQLGEDGVFNHCCGLEDGETHVPLLVRLPGGARAGRYDGLVELVDVMPTLLELAGATPPTGIRGRSLGPALRGEDLAGREVAWSQGGYGLRAVSGRTATGRLTYAGIPTASALFPDLLDAAALPGPGFTTTGTLADPEAVRGQMSAFMRSLSLPPERKGEELPDGLAAALRGHGYWTVDP